MSRLYASQFVTVNGEEYDDVFIVYRQWNFHGVDDLAEVAAQILTFEECHARAICDQRNEGTMGRPWRYQAVAFRRSDPFDSHVYRYQRYRTAKPHERRKMREGRV